MAPMESPKRRACSMIIGFSYLLILMIVVQGELGNLHPAGEYGN